ncbi:MAG: TetR/AcrR family transcriptional regulator [Candidatus Aminicenantes bacterium]|nr:TetR/AcrR family transcriptional regulator [Candidatus Aminicenantes bacterium]
MKVHGKKEVQANIKNSRLVDLRRKQIIEGAMQVFAAKGFHGATVREIAEAAGLTMGTMYNYVRSKEDILYIVYDFMTTLLSDGLKRTIEESTDPHETVRAALRHNMELLYQYQDVVMFLYRESGNYDRESVHTVLAQETRYIQAFEELLHKHFAGRKIDEDRLRLAADILSYLNVILVLRGWSLKRRHDSMDVVMDGILEFVEHAIEIVEEGDRDSVECHHFKKSAKSQSERRSKWGNRARKR